MNHAARGVLLGLGLILLFSMTGRLMGSQPQEVWHSGDLIIDGNEVFTIENVTYHQQGNIFVLDNAKLIIRNATLVFHPSFSGQYALRTFHSSRLEMESSSLRPAYDCSIESYDQSTVYLREVRCEGLFLLLKNQSNAFAARTDFRAVELKGTPTAKVQNAYIDGLKLTFGGDARVELSELRRAFYPSWSLRDRGQVTGTTLDLLLENTQVSRWSIGVRDSVNLLVKDSELSQVEFELQNAIGPLRGMRTGFYRDWELDKSNVRNVDFEMRLTNVQVNLYWSLWIEGSSDLKLSDSVLFLALVPEDSRVSVVDSAITIHASEYRGSLNAKHATVTGDLWLRLSSFSLTGSIQFEDSIRVGVWDSTVIEREYLVLITDLDGEPIENADVQVRDPRGRVVFEGKTDSEGKASFSLSFNDGNYRDDWTLAASVPRGWSTSQQIDFLTDTPIRITLARP